MNALNVKYKVTETGCFLVTSHAKKSDGTIRMRIDGKMQALHRWVYSRNVRPLLKNEFILRTCGENACINPKHMEVVTRFEGLKKFNNEKQALKDLELV